jgi:hypothetical protein
MITLDFELPTPNPAMQPNCQTGAIQSFYKRRNNVAEDQHIVILTGLVADNL